MMGMLVSLRRGFLLSPDESCRFIAMHVSYPSPKGRGLCLGSTATLHSEPAMQLWLHRSTHRGVLTRRPCSSSLAGGAAFARSHCEHPLNQHGGYSGNSDR